MFVILQAQVNVCASGVAFTQEDGATVEITWGLGEALVQGWVNPDRYQIVHQELVSQEIGKKRFALVPYRSPGVMIGDIVFGSWPWGDGHTKILDIDRQRDLALILVPSNVRMQPALFDVWINQLPILLERAHLLARHSVDLEFAIDHKEKIWWVQARPVTKRIPAQIKEGILIASGGCASGPARIIMDPKDINRVQIGDILVVPMTTPAYTSAMLRASAILSQESGLLCHTAIVARELNKPCLLNVTNAWEQIKDGEIIVVNADCGEWHRIKDHQAEVLQESTTFVHLMWVEQFSDIENGHDIFISAQNLLKNNNIRQSLENANCHIWVDIRGATRFRRHVELIRPVFGERLHTVGFKHDDFRVVSNAESNSKALNLKIGDPRFGLVIKIISNQGREKNEEN